MAAPVYKGTGAVFGTPGGASTTAAIGAPASIAVDDILYLIALTNSTTTLNSLPSGWAHVTGSPVASTGGSNNATLNVCWKRAVAGDVGAVSYTFGLSASDYCEGAISNASGAINSGSPWDTGAGAPAFAHTSAATGTAPAVALTTQGADRLLVNGAINQTGGTPWTASSGFTKDFDQLGTGAFATCTGYHKAQTTAGSTGNVQPVCPSSGEMVNFLGALLPTGGAAAVFVAAAPVRRRVQAPRRRPKAAQFVPAQVIVPPTIPVAVREARQVRGRLPRRGRVAAPVPPQVIVPPTIPTPARHPRRLRGLLPRHGRVAQVVPAQVTATPPSYPPPPVRVRRKGALVKRMRNDMPPVDQSPAPLPEAPRRRGLLPRRGRTVQVVPAQVVAPVVAWLPQPVRERIRGFLARRGRTRSPVPPQVVVPPPAYPPQPVHRTRFGMRRRTHGAEGWMVGSAAPTCDTPRPSTGTTTRPSSGTTAYSTAMTARPGTGTTAPPNTGTTDNPC